MRSSTYRKTYSVDQRRGVLVHVPRRRTGKKIKSSIFVSVTTTGYDTLLKFWYDSAIAYRVPQNQFLVILVHLRCFVVICLTSFFVFNTVLFF